MADETTVMDETLPASIVNSDGSFIENWQQSECIDEELRTEPSIKDFKDLNGAFRSLRDTKKLVGADVVKVPGDNATDADWDTFAQAGGWTAKAEDYTAAVDLQPLTDLPDGMKPDDELKEAFLGWAIEDRMLPGQARNIFNKFNEFMVARHNKQTDDFNLGCEKGMRELRTKLGAAYTQKRATAIEAVRQLAVDEGTVESLINDFDRSPKIAEFLIAVGDAIGEDRLKEHQQISAFTPADIQGKISEVINSKAYADFEYIRDHPQEHEEAVRKVEQLMKMRYPE